MTGDHHVEHLCGRGAIAAGRLRRFQNAWPETPNPPAITVVFVSGLAHPDFLVEVDAVAVVPQ